MNEVVAAISTGLVAFIATNLDDLVILLLLFAQVNATFRPQEIVTGQYLGFFVLVLLSLPGLLGGLVLSPNWIGLLGLLPMAIAISSFVNYHQDSSQDIIPTIEQSDTTDMTSFLSSQTYTVASITIANGSDNISVYVSLFANHNWLSCLVIIGLFFILLGMWCYLAYRLTNQKAVADFLTRYGGYMIPVVLMGLGVYIVLKSEALSLIKLVASCVCLMVLLKDDDRTQEVEKN